MKTIDLLRRMAKSVPFTEGARIAIGPETAADNDCEPGVWYYRDGDFVEEEE